MQLGLYVHPSCTCYLLLITISHITRFPKGPKGEHSDGFGIDHVHISICYLFCLFVSGERKGPKKEMNGFEHGKLSYVMTLIWATLSCQLCNIGSVRLIFQVSSLFSNVISTIALPLIRYRLWGFSMT